MRIGQAKLREEKNIIAKNLLKAGLADDLIVQITNLSIQDILKLKG